MCDGEKKSGVHRQRGQCFLEKDLVVGLSGYFAEGVARPLFGALVLPEDFSSLEPAD